MALTSTKLKHDIDRGRGGDKVNAIDPAAAPLGTDEEAAGAAPPVDAVAQAYNNEIDHSPVISQRKDNDHAVAIYVIVVATIALIVAVAIWYTQGVR